MEQPSNSPKTYGIYLYAIAPTKLEIIDTVLGVQEQQVYVLMHKDIQLIVSNLVQNKIRPERKNLAAHQTVLKLLMQHNQNLLPMRFGIVAANRNTACKLLTMHYSSLKAKLKELAGKIEMSVAISWDVPNIFEYLLEQHAALKTARDSLLQHAARPISRDEKIEIGALVSRILEQERITHTEMIVAFLTPICDGIMQNSCRNETDIMNLSCLLALEQQTTFDAKIDEMAQLLDNHFLIKYTGPWPPHNFAQLNLHL